MHRVRDSLYALSALKREQRGRVADKSCAVIEGLEREWRDALCSKDMDRLRALVHEDFVLIGTRRAARS